MRLGDKVILWAMVIGLIGFIVMIPVILHKSNVRAEWCKTRNLEFIGGGHSPMLCYDPKTRLVYKPE